MPGTNLFTATRLALWQAIDNWPALNPAGRSVFARKIKRNGDARLLPAATGPSIADTPAIDVRPGQTKMDWDVNRMEKVDYTLNVLITAMDLASLEQLVVDTWDAIYSAADPSRPNVSYIKAATSYHPMGLGVTWAAITKSVNDKKRVAETAVLAVGFRFTHDPFGNLP